MSETTTHSTDCERRGAHTHSPDEAAEMVGGVSPRTLIDKAGKRQIPSTKVGRYTRFTDEDIALIIASGARRPAQPRRDSRRRS